MRFKDDIGAPLAVTAIDLAVESWRPQWNEYASYVTTLGAWIAHSMGYAKGDFVKNMAIAATPWAAKGIYQRIRGISGSAGSPRRLAMNQVSRWPAPLVERPFGGARMV